MNTIAIVNHKGGVAKTTTAVNLAAGLARSGHRTLLIDFDPQGNASQGVGYAVDDITEGSPSMAQVVTSQTSLPEVVLPTAFENLWLAPADVRLAEAKMVLAARDFREEVLADALEALEGFAYVVIDTQPDLGTLLMNGLVAADKVLVPTHITSQALLGLVTIVKVINKAKRNQDGFDWRLLYTMVGGHGRARQEQIRAQMAPFDGRRLATEIRRGDAVLQSQEPCEDGRTVPLVLGGSRSDAARDYRQLIQEVQELWPATF